jgi:hypothetical protein
VPTKVSPSPMLCAPAQTSYRAPWDGLGASINLTFFRQPDTIGNVAVFYAIGRFEARREFQGRSSRLFADEIYSWTALVGATYAF